MRFYFCIFILYIPVFLSAQINMPFLENFSRDVYHGGTQNWAVAQGHDGIMYFANNDGLLTFDGKNGNRINCLPVFVCGLYMLMMTVAYIPEVSKSLVIGKRMIGVI